MFRIDKVAMSVWNFTCCKNIAPIRYSIYERQPEIDLVIH